MDRGDIIHYENKAQREILNWGHIYGILSTLPESYPDRDELMLQIKDAEEDSSYTWAYWQAALAGVK